MHVLHSNANEGLKFAKKKLNKPENILLLLVRMSHIKNLKEQDSLTILVARSAAT